MEKIVIVGVSGAGKTTLAKRLVTILKGVVSDIRAYHLDRVFWKRGKVQIADVSPLDHIVWKRGWMRIAKTYQLNHMFWKSNWKRIAREDRIDILQDIIQRESWIIEGSYFELSYLCLEEADTIIFLDLPPLICLIRVIKRHYKELLPRRDLPMECVDRLTLHLIKRILFFRFMRRMFVTHELRKYKDKGKEIITLRSPKEVDDFVTQVNDKAKASTLIPVG